MPNAAGSSTSLRDRLNSLQARMALILGIVLVPPLFYSVWQALDAYAAEQRRRTEAVERMIAVISAYEDDFFARAQTLLRQAAEALAAQGGDCEAALPFFARQSDLYRTLLLTDAEGRALCATDGRQPGSSIAARPYFEDLRRGDPFAVSGLVEEEGGGSIVVATLALREGTVPGDLRGTLSAGINLEGFAGALRGLKLPQGAVIHIVDREGRPLDVPPQAADPLPRPEVLARLLQEPGRTLDDVGRDGQARTYMVDPIAGGRLFVLGGVPQPERWTWLERDLIIGIFAPTLMLALAVVAIWIATDYLVNRHVRALAAAARAHSRGKTGARLRLQGAPTELHDLATTFNRMADRIHNREEQLKATIGQKEGLLKEIHHRVKNNLQIVISLLNLRGRRVASPEAQQALADAQTRIKALALVHRNLYAHEEVKWLEFDAFLRELAAMIEDTLGGGDVRLAVATEPLHVTVDQAIPLALLTVEGVSNAYKHAYPDRRGGRILLSLEKRGDSGRLVIADTGVGGGDASEGMGFTLIRMFVKQLRGDLVTGHANGTRMEVTFPLLPVEQERAV